MKSETHDFLISLVKQGNTNRANLPPNNQSIVGNRKNQKTPKKIDCNCSEESGSPGTIIMKLKVKKGIPTDAKNAVTPNQASTEFQLFSKL